MSRSSLVPGRRSLTHSRPEAPSPIGPPLPGGEARISTPIIRASFFCNCPVRSYLAGQITMPTRFDFCLPTRATAVPTGADRLREIKYELPALSLPPHHLAIP